jgi:hypothetical protein
MLSLAKCREILDRDSPESDADLELLRDRLYGLARVVVEACPRQRRGIGPTATQGRCMCDLPQSVLAGRSAQGATVTAPGVPKNYLDGGETGGGGLY